MFHGNGTYWRGRWYIDVELDCKRECELELQWKQWCIGIGRRGGRQ